MLNDLKKKYIYILIYIYIYYTALSCLRTLRQCHHKTLMNVNWHKLAFPFAYFHKIGSKSLILLMETQLENI